MSAANTNQETPPSPVEPAQWSPVRAANEVLWRDLLQVYGKERKAHPGRPGATVFYGTSTIRVWESLAEDFPGSDVIGIGLPAANLGVLARFHDELIAPLAPARLVLYAGASEAMKSRDHGHIMDGLTALCARARQRDADLPIFLLSLVASPSFVIRCKTYVHVNRTLAGFAAAAKNVTFIDAATPFGALPEATRISLFADDHIHFTRAGFALFADLLRPALAPHRPAKGPPPDENQLQPLAGTADVTGACAQLLLTPWLNESNKVI